mgnify:CR=1 FL=1
MQFRREGGLIRPQEGIRCLFFPKCGRDCRFLPFAKFDNLGKALFQCCVVRLNGKGETAVCLRIFMGAIDTGAVRQGAEFFEAVPHLLRCAFKKPTAAEREQRIAAEQRIGIFKPVGDMADCMSRHFKYPGRFGAKFKDVAIFKADINARNARRVLFRPHNGAPCFFLQRQISAGMVTMMVGIDDVGQLPAEFRQLFQYRLGNRRVDNANLAAVAFAEQIDIIVVKNRNLVNFEFAHKGIFRIHVFLLSFHFRII